MAERIVRWIHISDWHVTDPPSRDCVAVLKALAKDIEHLNSSLSFCPDFIVHTGDIAFSGQEKEYDAAIPYLTNVVKAAGVDRTRLFLVPGNHDVYDAVAQDIEADAEPEDEERYSKTGDELWDSPTKRQGMMQRFKYFHSVMGRLVPATNICGLQMPCFVSIVEARGGPRVGIAGMNSAMISHKDDAEVKREMLLGRWQVEDTAYLLRKKGTFDLSIALFHHALSDLTPYDGVQCRKALRASFDLGLHGHGHTSDGLSEVAPDGSLVVLAAGATQHVRWKGNSYIVTEANLTSNLLRYKIHRWNPEDSEFQVVMRSGEPSSRDGWNELPLDVWAAAKRSSPFRHYKYGKVRVVQRKHALPTSGLEEYGVFAGYVDHDSHLRTERSVREALSHHKSLPNKHLFWHPDSQRLYHEGSRHPAYTIARDSAALWDGPLKSLVGKLLGLPGSPALTLVSLGVGSGDKELWLLRELFRQEANAKVQLLFVDINEEMLRRSMSQFGELCAEGRVQAAFVHGDFEQLPHLAPLIPEMGGPIIFLALGGVFGNQEETRFLKSLIQISDDRCYLLLGVQSLEAITDDQTLAGYGTEPAYRFVELPLLAFDPMYDPEKGNIHADYSDSPPSDVSESLTIAIFADSPSFGKVQLGFSRRYRREHLADYLESIGCKIVWESGHASERYWKVLVKLPPSS